MKVLAVSLFFSTLFLCAAGVQAAERVQAGEWETTLSMGTGKPIVAKYCISAAEAKAMNGDEAGLRKYLEESTASNTKGRCTVKSVKLEGDTSSVALVCGKIEVASTTRYFGDRYESKSSSGTAVAGKRLGDCPKP